MNKRALKKDLCFIMNMSNSELSANGDLVRLTVAQALDFVDNTATGGTKKKATKKKEVKPKGVSKAEFDSQLADILEDCAFDYQYSYTVKLKNNKVIAVKFAPYSGTDFPDDLIEVLVVTTSHIDKNIEIYFEGYEEEEEERVY